MERKNIFALLALLGLVGLAVWSLGSPEKGDRVGERPRPVAEIKAGSITTFEVTQPGGKDKVTVTKKGDKWQVTSPFDKPADQGAAKSAVEALEKLKWGDVTTQKKDTHAELEVSDDKAVHVLAKDSGGAVLADLYLGKAAGSGTFVRVAGKDDVWQVGDLYASTFKREGKTWREHMIFSAATTGELKADEADKVTIKGGGSKITLERIQPEAPKDKDGKDTKPSSIYDAKWRIAESEPGFKPSKELDNGVLNRIAQSLSTLRAEEFLDDAKPEELGLAPGAPGQIEISVVFKGGQGATKTGGVRIGQLKGDSYYAQTLDSPQVFTVKKWGMEPLARLPQDVRDKTLLTLKADQIAEIQIVQDKDVVALKYDDKAKAWKADKLADTDDAKIKAVTESFDNLSGAGFIAAGSAELASLTTTKTSVTIKPKTGTPLVLKLGDIRNNEDVAVQLTGQEPMWLKKFSVDRFLKKPADLQKDKK